MATRYGWEKAEKLLDKGWKVKAEPITFPITFDNFQVGDPIMVDPLTEKEYTPYEAEKIQLERETNGSSRT